MMMLRRFVVMTLMVVTARGNELIALSDDDKQSIVDKHNELRRSVGASDMEYMMWDDDLAAGAAILADTCVYEHNYLTWDGSPFGDDIGQNIFSSSSPYGPSWPLEFWWSENAYYDYATGDCSWQCDHYTQMAWWNNIRVGCAKAHCQPLYTPGAGYQSDNYYFVCNYAPGGNFEGQQPYKEGEGCSQCENRLNDCHDGLCLSQDVCYELNLEPCTCSIRCENCGKLEDDQCYCECPPGYFGMSCEHKCVDLNAMCGTEWGQDMCLDPDTKQQMYNQCPAFCGVCAPLDEVVLAEWCATTEAPPTTHISTTLGSPTTTTMYQQLCYLYGLFCDMARALDAAQKRRRELE